MTADPINTYRRQIEKALQAGNATERTHYPALKTLIQSLAAGITTTIVRCSPRFGPYFSQNKIEVRSRVGVVEAG